MKHNYYKIVFAALISACLLFSCKREFEKPRWDTQILAPLVKSKLTIKDIIKDTSIVQTEADNSITLVNRQKIFNYTIDSLITLSAPPFKRTAKLSSLVLDSQQITRRISLGEIALQMKKSSDFFQSFLGDQIIKSNGTSIAYIPPISNITAGPIPIDISSFFKTATLQSGKMYMSITNELPLTLSKVEFQLNNTNPTSLIASQTFTNVATNQTKKDSIDLANKTIGSIIEALINEMDFAGGSNVPIDTSKALVVTISIKNIKVQSATAIFPAQNVMDTTTIVGLVDMKDVL
ncbi:MAG: hypothetical protein H7259_08220, partial [Cytophagales bacterium]|nr:hypothetical protein [Cytophaga sp.]